MWRADKAGWIGVIALTLAFAACGSKGSEQPANAEPPSDPAALVGEPGDKTEEPATPADPAAQPADPAAKPADPAAKPADPAAKPEDPAAQPADPAAADPNAADAGAAADPNAADAGPSEPDAVSKHGFVYPGKNTIVRECDPESPEGVIQRALAAAMDPDEEKGWEAFEALLHTSEKIPNALISRRQLNFPAMRRKVSLFLVEEGKPYYKWAYAEEPEEDTIKVFVNNPKSMPTPCYLAKDPEQDNKWRIKSCSL